ncbi:MAG: hypothetical protein C0483_07640 [Pirellula sp.]|nr:hypothetical protein [Pirellula sp.]
MPFIEQHRRLLAVAMLLTATLSGCAKPAAEESVAAVAPNDYTPQLGDILFQSLPHSPLIDAIEGATHSKYSHCGIVAPGGNGGWVVVEANGSVKETRLDAWIAQGREKAYAVYRYDSQYTDKLPQVVAAARGFLGKPYDMHYAFGDDALYCSELIFKAFKQATGEECGKIVTLGDLDWKPHETVIRFLERGGLPLEREMITPIDLANAKQLKLVLNRGL